MSVAEASQHSGISVPYLYQIEDGRRNPSAKVLARLAAAYKVRLEDLLVKAELLPAAVVDGPDSEPRSEKISRAFEFVLRDPGVRAGSEAMQKLPDEARLAIIRLYERAEGLRILPDDFA